MEKKFQNLQFTDCSTGIVNDQLSKLQPTKELVSFYRNRVLAFEKEYEELLDVVEECKQLCDRSYQLEQELQQCIAESLELRKTVSDLQAYIFQERSEVLRLFAENDNLKIREADARKKIELLLTIHEEYNHRDIPIVISDSCNHPKVVRKTHKCVEKKLKKQQKDVAEIRERNRDVGLEQVGSDVSDPEILKMQVMAFSSQLAERTNLFQDQIDTLLKDRELTWREHEKDLDNLHCKIDSLTKSLKDAQDKLCDATLHLVEEKADRQKNETLWIAEQDKIFRAKEASKKCSELSNRLQQNEKVFSVSSKMVKSLQQDLKIVQHQLKEQDKVVTAYREHCHLVEDELYRVREQLKKTEENYKEKLKKLSEQASFWKEKYNRVDCQRRLQSAGFFTDIKMMRARLKVLEEKTQKRNTSSHAVSNSISHRTQNSMP